MTTHEFAVTSSIERFTGAVITVVSDAVRMPDGDVSVRDYVRHPGAVGVVALDGAGRVLLVKQYRHPVGRDLWELPAGLLDVAHEPAVLAARRELSEEADVRAGRWDVLADVLTSPGCSDEAIRLFLARDLTAVPDPDRHVRTHEEATMLVQAVDLDTAVGWALAGDIENAACIVGVLAAARARDTGFAGLRPADAPWQARPPAGG